MVETAMSLVEGLAALAAGRWVELLCGAAALGALGVSLRVMRRAARDRQRLDDMRRDLQAFTEASTRVADTLNHLLNGDVTPAEQAAPSRRYLLLRAREGLENGESVDELAARLDLCEDERKLLEFLHSSNNGGQRVQALAKHAWVA